MAIRHLGGRKQLAISPTEKVIAIVPLLVFCLRIAIPPSLTYYCFFEKLLHKIIKSSLKTNFNSEANKQNSPPFPWWVR